VRLAWHEASKMMITRLPQKHPLHGPPHLPHHPKSLTIAPGGLVKNLYEYTPRNMGVVRLCASVIGDLSCQM
jgi:hypothetical protein